jgi:hypothetical protein
MKSAGNEDTMVGCLPHLALLDGEAAMLGKRE